MRLLPVLMLAVFLGFVGFGRMLLHRWRFGRWGWAMSKGRPLDAAQVVLIAAGFALCAQAALVALGSRAAAALALPNPFGIEHPLFATGLAAIALAVVLAAQLQMGASWRIGIEEDARPGLVTHGLYGRCRNPIYLGMLIGLVAFALEVPTWLSLATLVVAAVAIAAIVNREEAYLRRTYGDAFERYAKAVPRFLPRPC